MKKIPLFFLVILLLLSLESCLTTDQPSTFDTYIFDNNPASALDSPVVVPEIRLFVSAPLVSGENESELSMTDLVLPEVEIPVKKRVVPPAAAPVKVRPSASPVPLKVSSTANADVQPQSEQVAKTDTPPEKLSARPGEKLEITLSGEGWIFDGSTDGTVKLIDRNFSGGSTVFHIEASAKGIHKLNFTLQNLSTGEEKTKSYSLDVQTPEEDNNSLPVIINSGEEDLAPAMGNEKEKEEMLNQLVAEENIPAVVASLDSVLGADDDLESELLKKIFDLLDGQGGYTAYLIKLAEDSHRLYPYNDYSAEMLFRAAKAVEQPGADQDIERALTLFKEVRDYYPLSTYSDQAVDRIRYLERHFMKIY